MKNRRLQLESRALLAAIQMLFLAFAANLAASQTLSKGQPQILQPNQLLERELAEAQKHYYQFDLYNNEFFQVRVEQKGVDVQLKLMDASGNVVTTMDSPNGIYGPETLSFVAQKAGRYTLEVSKVDAKAEMGTYIIKREASRKATAKDRRRVQLERLFVEAISAQASASQIQTAITRLEEASGGWRELQDEYMAELTSQLIGQLKKVHERPNIRPLVVGEIVTRQLKGSEVHLYAVELKQGQVLRIDLREKGVDARVALARVDDQRPITKSDFGFGYDRETLTAVAERAATYALIVGTPESGLSGSYELLAQTKEAATAEDIERIEAGSLLSEGLESQRKESAKGLRGGVAKCEESLKIWKRLGDTYWEGYTNNLLGKVYMALGEKQRALDYFSQALPLFRALGDRSAEAQTLNNAGRLYAQIGDKRLALEYYLQGLPLFKAVSDKAGEAATLNNIGWLYAELGERQKALDYFDQALLLRREAGDKGGEAQTLNNIAWLYAELGERRKALEFFNQALPLSRAVGNEHAEAAVLNNMGSIYSRLGEKQRALDYFSKALLLSRAVGNRGAEAQTLSNVGSIYSDLGEKQRALDYFSQALPLFRALGDKAGEATALNNIGSLHSDSGDKRLALEYYLQGLPLFKAVSDKAGEAATLNNIGWLYAELGERQKALDYFDQALLLRREAGDKGGEAQTLNYAGRVYAELGERQKALELFNRALLLRRVVGDKSGEAQTLSNMTDVWESLNNRRMSVFYCKLLVNKYQELRGATQGLDIETQKSFLRSVQNAYRKLACLLIQEGQLEQAIEVLILYQDQQFFDSDNDSNTPVSLVALSPREESFARLYDAEPNNVRQISSQIEELRRRIGNHQPDEQETAQLQKLETALKTSSDAFLSVPKVAEQQFANPLGDEDRTRTALKVTEMRAALRTLRATTNQEPVILYTLVGEDNFYILLIRPDAEVEGFASPVKAADLNNKLLGFQAVLQSPISDPRPLGRELYDIIFKPVATELKKTGAQILMWSLDDNLRYVPMAALWDGEKYLVESYQNVSFTRADSARMTRDVSRKWSGVAFGNSRPQVVDVSDSMVPFPGLPSVTKELSTIFNPQPTGTTGITKGEIFIDKRFTKETFYRALRGRPSLVHISSHFSIRPGDDTRSFLLLGDGATLTLSEMEKQRRLFEGVELLVLSACNTAATQPNAMDREVDGFAELAQRLGADAVVSTLWQSSDAATSHLMQKFYATLKSTSEMTKAEALRQAQLELLNGAAETEPLVEVSGGMSNAEPIISDEPKQNRHGNEKTQGNVVYVRPKDVPPFKGAAGKPFAHPHYWAPFILIGNWK